MLVDRGELSLITKLIHRDSLGVFYVEEGSHHLRKTSDFGTNHF